MRKGIRGAKYMRTLVHNAIAEQQDDRIDKEISRIEKKIKRVAKKGIDKLYFSNTKITPSIEKRLEELDYKIEYLFENQKFQVIVKW